MTWPRLVRRSTNERNNWIGLAGGSACRKGGNGDRQVGRVVTNLVLTWL